MLLVEETYKKYGYYIEDFSEFSRKKVIVQCDYCGDKVEKTIANFNLQRKKSGKDSCNKRECRNKKISETKLKKSGVPKGYRRCSICKEVKELNENNFTRGGRYGFRYECKICSKNKYHENKRLISEAKIPLKEAIEIYEELLTKNITPPYNFMNRIDDLNGFVKYIFKERTNEYYNKFKNVDMHFIKQYKLYPLLRKYKTIYNLINTFFPDYIQPWELKKAPQGIWRNDEQVKKALKWFIEKLKEDKVIDSIEDLPKVCHHELFEKYQLGGLLHKRFNGSPYDAINFIFPNKFLRRSFNLPAGYYNDINNRKEITQEFVQQLLKDKVIESIDDIPHKVDINTFKKYGLSSFLIHVYQGVSWKAFNELYPNKWKIWEFNSCPNGFWDDVNNIYECTDWLIDKLFKDKIIKNISELPNVFSFKLFSHYNLARMYDKRDIVYEYISKKYPNELTIKSFEQCIANDGTRCLSKQEVIIHNLFLDNNINAKYCTKTTLFYNEEYNERYAPDWIINDNIIVEYFGLYVDNYHSFTLLKNYREKTGRKIKFYNSLNNYKFIDLYPQDIENNFKGLIDKFNKIGIQIEVS